MIIAGAMKNYLFCFISFLVLGLLMIPMRGGYLDFGPFEGFCLSSFAGSLIGYFLLWYFLSKQNTVWMWGTAILGLFLFTLPIHVIKPQETMVSLLEMVVHFVALSCAYIAYRYLKNIYVRGVFSLFVFIGVYWLSVPCYRMWIHYLGFGTFDGIIRW